MVMETVFVAHIFAEDDGTQFVGVYSTPEKAQAALREKVPGVLLDFEAHTIKRGPKTGIRFWTAVINLDDYSVREERVR